MTNHRSLHQSNVKCIKQYIRVFFGFCCILWALVAISHYGNDGTLFDYEYISSNGMIRRLLSDQETYKEWNDIVKNEFSGSNLREMDAKTSSRIIEMIQDDKAAINENSAKFHKILPEYIVAKRQIHIEEAALKELKHKRHKVQKSFESMQISTKKEQIGIEAVTETGTKPTNSHKTLGKDLEDEVVDIKKQLNEINHLIHATSTSRDQWLKKADNLHQQLLSIMKLDKTDRAIESALSRLVHVSSNRECYWKNGHSKDCSFQSDIDVGMQFDTHYFIIQNPPNYINLKTIDVTKSEENEDDLCRIKVFIGVNDICSDRREYVPREICTVNFSNSTKQNDDCSECNGANIDLIELEKSLVSKEKEKEILSTFCVIMKRHYVYDTGHNPQCRAKAKVEITAATHFEKGHIACPVAHDGEGRRNNERKTTGKKREKTFLKREKEKMKVLEDKEQKNYAWRRIVGYWPYCATLLTVLVGIGSFFIMYH